MASGICYTQSGGVKKYDGIVVPAVAKGDESYNPGYDNIKHDTSSVPGEDHYSFDDPSSYTLVEKGSSARDDCPLIIVTYYPVAPANPCYFNYKKKIVSTITIYVDVKVYGYNYNGRLTFDCLVSGDRYDTSTNKEIINNILKNNSIYLSWKVVTPSGPFGSYTTRIISTGSLTLNTGANYVNSTIQYYIDGGNPPYCSPSSGTYNGVNWKINVHTITQ